MPSEKLTHHTFSHITGTHTHCLEVISTNAVFHNLSFDCPISEYPIKCYHFDCA